MHAVEQILLKVKEKLDAANTPSGPVVRFFKNQPRSEGEGGAAGTVIIALGSQDPSDDAPSVMEMQSILWIDLGLAAPIPDADATGYGPMLALDDFVMNALFDDTNLDGLAADIQPGTIEPMDEENPDIGEIVRKIPVAWNALWTRPAHLISA